MNTFNDNSVNSNWGGYRTSVDAVERATGLDLLSEKPLGVHAAVKAQVDSEPTQRMTTETKKQLEPIEASILAMK